MKLTHSDLTDLYNKLDIIQFQADCHAFNHVLSVHNPVPPTDSNAYESGWVQATEEFRRQVIELKKKALVRSVK